MQQVLRLQDGTVIPGNSPVVVLGPNGSGKTRQTRTLTTEGALEFVNALRNTRVSPTLPATAISEARNQFNAQKNQAKAQHWEISSEFDQMLSQLLAENSVVATEYLSKARVDKHTDLPALTPLGRIEDLWKKVFPGRELFWRELSPNVRNSSVGEPVEYSAHQMSDGEKAALFLAGRVLSAEPGVIVVDEPETHLHSLLAVRLWNELEAERPDIRFVYVTHDLTFALSRSNAQFVLASPSAGLKLLDLGGPLPSDVAEVLLGSASLSFYATRVVFCEGADSTWDNEFYNAWFHGRDTVVRSVGSSEMVMRCTDALRKSGVANSLTSIGLIDRDFHPDALLAGLPDGVIALRVHEIESLLALPAIVGAVAQHLGREFDPVAYLTSLADSVTDQERHKVVLERWKARVSPKLEGLVSAVSTRAESLDDIVQSMPDLFDYATWQFSPEELLKDEKKRVESLSTPAESTEFLTVLPGKRFLALAARAAALQPDDYIGLITQALLHSDDEASQIEPLGKALEAALSQQLPPRSHEPVA